MSWTPLSNSCAEPVSRRLCATPVGEIREWVCAGHDTARGEMEVSESWSVVVTRRGAFARDDGAATDFLAPGAASFWNLGESYSLSHPVKGGDHCTVFRLSEQTMRAMLAGSAAQDAESPRFSTRAQRLGGKAYLLHRRALQAARADLPDELEVEESMLEFLSAAYPTTASKSSPNVAASSRHLARAAEEVVASRFRQHLTLDEVARDVGCSPFHLTRVMRVTTGESLHQHVMRLRLREAMEQLLDSTHDISRIALDAGFASHSHMTTAFGREYGLTPHAARRERSPVA